MKFSKKFLAESYHPFSVLVLDYSVEILKDIKSFFSTGNPDELKTLQKSVEFMGEYNKSSDDEVNIQKLENKCHH